MFGFFKKKPAPAPVEPARVAAPAAVHAHTVLLVEDDPDVRSYAVRCLTNLGYDVVAAVDVVVTKPGYGIVTDAIAAGNLGCITQIASGTGIPVVHTVELIDWATGGPVPLALEARQRQMSA